MLFSKLLLATLKWHNESRNTLRAAHCCFHGGSRGCRWVHREREQHDAIGFSDEIVPKPDRGLSRCTLPTG